MIYDEPRFLPGGDKFIEMELGDEMSFDCNFLVHSVAALVRQAKIKGIVELVPELATIMISYDGDQISFADVVREVGALRRSIGSLEDQELDSRLIYFPVLYVDPWTRACYDDYCVKIAKKEWDPELLVRVNNLENVKQLIRVHSGCEYWVAALGFWPGLASHMPLDPRCVLTAPKYNPPRTWTPKQAIGVGGGLCAIYPDQTPGGYQIFARTPAPIWEPTQTLPAFKESLALFRPGDRVRFVPVDREEYDYVEQKVAEGTYQHVISDFQKFSIRRYHAWLRTIDPSERF